MFSVMIIDDEALICSMLADFIDQTVPGFFACATFTDAKRALERLHAQPVDVIVTDIRMPAMSGLELAHAVKECHWDIPIVIISGYSDFAYAKQAIQYGVFNYILKPIDFEELANTFEQIRVRLESKQAVSPEPEAKEPGANGNKQQIFAAAIAYIERNYARDLSRDDVAAACFVSPSYLSHIFKETAHKGFVDYLNQYRIARAIELLGENIKIGRIMELTGFRSRGNFQTNFRAHTGMTPNEFRHKVLNMKDERDE